MTMRTAIGYARVSTERQADEGTSLDVQAEKVAALCELRGWKLAQTFSERGVSGSSVKRRHQLTKALAAVCECKGVLVFYDLSRLARNTNDALEICDQLRECGADLASCTEPFDSTASGRLMFEMLAAFAAYFARVTGEKIAAANRRTVKRLGHRTNGPQPYGWMLNEKGERVPHPEQSPVVAQMRSLRSDGLSVYRIAAYLNEQGIPAKLKKGWCGDVVRRILNAPERPPC
jgi:DNA invertase Pin-like site-specific DNA recombinase